MRPLRLLLSLCTSLIALTLLLYVAFGPQPQQNLSQPLTPPKKSRLKALFSFSSPVSLFPPSAIISLTDDNSTFFLARPAAFGPLLPSKGLSGAIWIGSGFGDDAMGRGELGCSDVPDWSDGTAAAGSKVSAGLTKKPVDTLRHPAKYDDAPRPKRTTLAGARGASSFGWLNDGTDDYLHLPSSRGLSRAQQAKASEHADIQSLQEGAEIAGKVVLLKRGGCGFLEKVKWAQKRGAVALIVGDNERGGPLILMYAHGDTSNITIPAIFTTHTTAQLLSSLLPPDGLSKAHSPQDAAEMSITRSGKRGKFGKNTSQTGKQRDDGSRPSTTQSVATATHAFKLGSNPIRKSEEEQRPESLGETGWLQTLLHVLSPRTAGGNSDNHRALSYSGNPDYVLVKDWDDDRSGQKPMETKQGTRQTSTIKLPPDDFVIGEQDWRDAGLVSHPSPVQQPYESAVSRSGSVVKTNAGSILPSSGEYSQDREQASTAKGEHVAAERHGWFGSWWRNAYEAPNAKKRHTDGGETLHLKKAPSQTHTADDDDDGSPDNTEPHEGLWVTLTPTNMSSSPFFDTLLVLVVSPLVTLTVVYALLLLRSRIRRRRWRAPKSVVERLPVRTYHTISDATPAATPATSSPSTPLLQQTISRPPSSHHSGSDTAPEVPASSSSLQQGGRTSEEEKREAGLAEWRRRYGGRQKECVVCLEEYVDGVSKVMSLPCGHEFHADCITPWLVTRRRTCPICKGDVVRSLSNSYYDRDPPSPSQTRSPRSFREQSDEVQAEAAETRNDSPSASRPIPISASSNDLYNDFDEDVEADWPDDSDGRRQSIPQNRMNLSSSMRDLSSTVTTTIWRGVDAIRGATGLQRRPSQEEIDRNR